MRILHVFIYYRPQFTGEGIFLERLAPILARLAPEIRHEVAVTNTPAPAGTYPMMAGIDAVHYLNTDASKTISLRLMVWMMRNRRRFDVVHFHAHADRSFLSYGLLKLLGCLLIRSATLNDSGIGIVRTYRPALRPLIRRVLSVFDQNVVISPKLLEETAPLTGAHKCHLVPIGIAIPKLDIRGREKARARLQIDAARMVLMTVGGICERKDQFFIIQQLPIIVKRYPSLLMIFVGPVVSPSYHAQIMKYIDEHRLKNNIRFAGYQESPWDYYLASDLMVFASRAEGFGTAQIEAMAFRLPVVARRLAGVNDGFILPRQTGFLFEDEGEFRCQVFDLLANSSLRRQVGDSARASIAGSFDIEKIAQRYLAIYGSTPGSE